MIWILLLLAVGMACAAAPPLLFRLFLLQARGLHVEPSPEDRTISYPLV